MLAALGVLFAAAGVGDGDRRTDQAIYPSGQRFLTVAVFGLGMAMFTIIMGNAFAAFPVMAAAIGVPLLIQGYRRQSRGGRRGRDAERLLRDADDADGRQFQSGPGGAAGIEGPIWRDPRPGRTALPLLAVNILIIYFAAFR